MDDEMRDETEAAIEIGQKVLEMVDRLKVANACAPGAQARWAVTVDNVRYGLLMMAEPAQAKQ